MFRGVNALQLDTKGRLAVPARYRQRLLDEASGRLVATIDTDERCLLIYPLPSWEDIEKQLSALPSFDPLARKIQRLLLGYASDLEMDPNGRVLLPALLREYAGLEKSAVLIGQGKKFELWSEERWQMRTQNWLEEARTDIEKLPEALRLLSL